MLEDRQRVIIENSSSFGLVVFCGLVWISVVLSFGLRNIATAIRNTDTTCTCNQEPQPQ